MTQLYKNDLKYFFITKSTLNPFLKKTLLLLDKKNRLSIYGIIVKFFV